MLLIFVPKASKNTRSEKKGDKKRYIIVLYRNLCTNHEQENTASIIESQFD